MKRSALLVIALLLVTAVLYGCSNNNAGSDNNSGASASNESKAPDSASTEKKEKVKLKYYVPGSEKPDQKMVFDLVNKKLEADGFNFEIEKVFIPSDAWDQKINLMLSTGEDFDLFHVMQDRTPFTNYLNRGALADLTDSINKYGANLKKAIPEDIFEGAQVNGKTYVVPAYWVEMASEGEFDIRTDILKNNNLEMPKTPDELLTAMDTVMKNWKGGTKPYLFGTANFDPVGFHTTVLHRTYDTFPFTIKDKFVYVNQNGDVKSWLETDEFKQDAAFMRKAYKMGVVNPDILVVKKDQIKAQLDNGDWFVMFGSGGDLKSLQKNNPDATINDIQAVYFNPEKPYLRPLTVKNANAVPITSKHVDEVVQFLDWMVASQENYDLVQYGIEGTHYEKDGDRGIKTILDPKDNSSRYAGSNSQIGNVNFVRLDQTNSIPSNNKVLYEPNTNAVNSIAANFVFDPTNVRAEYSNITTEAEASITPIYMGVQDYDKAFPAALEKMKKAGLDKVIAEWQKQFKDYLASK